MKSELSKTPILYKRDSSIADWLIENKSFKAGIYKKNNHKEIVMTNGLISRKWKISPNVATISYVNHTTDEQMIRGIKPEAIVTLNQKEYKVGGLDGQVEYAYLQEDILDGMTANIDSFQFKSYETGKTKERFPWKRKRYSEDLPWPAPGVSITFHFIHKREEFKDVVISIHYEMYDGIPLLSKWISIQNNGRGDLHINHFVSEILAVVETEENFEDPNHAVYSKLHVESDYAFYGLTSTETCVTTYYVPDRQYTTKLKYYTFESSLQLESRPPIGPDEIIRPGQLFETFRTYNLALDSSERERRSLAKRKMYRTVAPWITENPIFMHVISEDPEEVRAAIDQCVEVGFEMVILSFRSGMNLESEDPIYIEQMKELAAYAQRKGVELGGYSLLASRSISKEDDIINSDGAKFGHSPCLGSRWGEDYFRKVQAFLDKTGFSVFEHDGSYPGDICESSKHPGHRGKADSQWKQWKKITDFYKWCTAKGIYLNVPDWYFLSGSNKIGMGYHEVNWSLPRERQIIIARQNIYDGSWGKTPSMGWMFVPLTEYHGGGEEATIEPLSEHLNTYNQHLANNFTAGVQAIYRGLRLFDTEETKHIVKKWVDFYKKYRDILDSDIIHVRRPDGRGIDCILHVNPQLPYKGLAVVHNPLDKAVEQQLKLPLYYTGLSEMALVFEQDGKEIQYHLDRYHNIELPIRLKAKSSTWFLIK